MIDRDPDARSSGAERGAERGVGMIGSAAGLLVALLFLAFSAQVLLGLYATTTVRATLHDAAARAASWDGPDRPAAMDRIAAEATASLGRMGERTEIELVAVDDDGDGVVDVIAGHAVARPPRVAPASLGGMLGFEQIRVGVRVRIERMR